MTMTMTMTTMRRRRMRLHYYHCMVYLVIGVLIVYNLGFGTRLSTTMTTLSTTTKPITTTTTTSTTTTTTSTTTSPTTSTTTSYVVHTCLHPAGLLDRQEVITQLLELTQYLQALGNTGDVASGGSSGSGSSSSNNTTTKTEDYYYYYCPSNENEEEHIHHHHLHPQYIDHVVRLEFPTPRQAFHTMHNSNSNSNHHHNNGRGRRRKKLDPNLKWNDFWVFRPTTTTTTHHANTTTTNTTTTGAEAGAGGGGAGDTAHLLLLSTTTKLKFDPIFYYQLQLQRRRKHPRHKYCRSPRRWLWRRRSGVRSSNFNSGGPVGGNGQDDGDDHHTTINDTIHLISTTPDEVIEHFDFLRRHMMMSMKNKKMQKMPSSPTTTPSHHHQPSSFVWEIAVNFYSFHKQMTQHLQSLLVEEQQQQQQQQGEDEPQGQQLLSSSAAAANANCSTMVVDNNTSPQFGTASILNAAPFLPWIRRSNKYVERLLPPTILKLIDQAWQRVVVVAISPVVVDDGDAASTASTTTKSNNDKKKKKNTAISITITGFLHIRRGDTQHECDTSITKLRNYLNCSLNTMTLKLLKQQKLKPNNSNSNSKNNAIAITGVDVVGRNTTNYDEDDDEEEEEEEEDTTDIVDLILLVSTNERDPSYVQSVQTMITNDLSPLRVSSSSSSNNEVSVMINIRPVNAEELVWSTLRQAVHLKEIPKSYLNNFHVFMILQQLKDKVHVKLQQRRIRQCKDCDDVGAVVVPFKKKWSV